jgi:uncharacterized protein (DUF952 family)
LSLAYKILTRAEWDQALAAGVYEGSAVDRQDGFIHLSTAAQAPETARRYFAGQTGLVVLQIDTDKVAGVRWEPSRGGDLFPHIYGPLDPALVRAVTPAPLGADGAPLLGPLA